MKEKLKELIDKEIDINTILLKAIAERKAEIAHKKTEIGATPPSPDTFQHRTEK